MLVPHFQPSPPTDLHSPTSNFETSLNPHQSLTSYPRNNVTMASQGKKPDGKGQAERNASTEVQSVTERALKKLQSSNPPTKRGINSAPAEGSNDSNKKMKADATAGSTLSQSVLPSIEQDTSNAPGPTSKKPPGAELRTDKAPVFQMLDDSDGESDSKQEAPYLPETAKTLGSMITLLPDKFKFAVIDRRGPGDSGEFTV